MVVFHWNTVEVKRALISNPRAKMLVPRAMVKTVLTCLNMGPIISVGKQKEENLFAGTDPKPRNGNATDHFNLRKNRIIFSQFRLEIILLHKSKTYSCSKFWHCFSATVATLLVSFALCRH